MELENLQTRKKVYTRWCNMHLQTRGIVIKDIINDFKNSVNLLHLVEILTATTIPALKPFTEPEILQNFTNAFNVLKGLNVNFPDKVTVHSIYYGNENAILKLVGILAMKFQVGEETELMKWINSKVNSNFPVRNFSSDWKSGVPLCWLVESVSPGCLMDLPFCLTYDAVADTTLALKAAKEILLPSLLEVEEIVSFPDHPSMALFLSYFRGYVPTASRIPASILSGKGAYIQTIKQNNSDEVMNCSAYGEGLNEGVLVKTENFFTVEVRNSLDRCVGKGGYNIVVEVVSPNYKQTAQILDQNNGKFFVKYMTQEKGKHDIHVIFQDPPICGPIQGSPFCVEVRGKLEKKPLAHWFVVLDAATHKYRPYSKEISDLLEKSVGKVSYDDSLSFDLNNLHEIWKTKRRDIVRGTWFWRCDDGSWAPYDYSIAEKLEQNFKTTCSNGSASSEVVSFSDKAKKQRFVMALGDGTFRQFRISAGASQGRCVMRGYLGQIIEEES